MALHLSTCLIGQATLLACRLRVDFSCTLPTNSLSAHHVLLQLANDHLLLLIRSYVTLCQMMTLHLRHHWQNFGEN